MCVKLNFALDYNQPSHRFLVFLVHFPVHWLAIRIIETGVFARPRLSRTRASPPSRPARRWALRRRAAAATESRTGHRSVWIFERTPYSKTTEITIIGEIEILLFAFVFSNGKRLLSHLVHSLKGYRNKKSKIIFLIWRKRSRASRRTSRSSRRYLSLETRSRSAKTGSEPEQKTMRNHCQQSEPLLQ